MTARAGDGSAREEAMRTLEHEIGLLLRRVRKGVADRAGLVHPDLHATSFTLLLTLVDYGPRRAADLADMFALDKGAVSRVVKQLLDLGFIERTPDPADGRASILVATDRARDRLEVVRGERREDFDARLADWTPESIAGLAGDLARLNAAIFD